MQTNKLQRPIVGFGHTMYCIVWDAQTRQYDITTLEQFILNNNRIKRTGGPSLLMIDGLFSCKSDAKNVLKDITEPILVLKNT